MNPKDPKPYDAILRALDNSKIINDVTFREMPELKGQNVHAILNTLKANGFIEHIGMNITKGELYRISPKGKEFIGRTSFEEQYRDEQIERDRELKAQSKANKLSLANVIVAGIAIISSVAVSLYIANDSTKKTDVELYKLKQQVDSVNKKIDSLNRVIKLNNNERKPQTIRQNP